MKTIANKMRAAALALACLMGIGTVWAQSTPEVGKQYRIRNVRSGNYLTTQETQSATLVLQAKENTERQFWTFTNNTAGNASFTNVGYQNAGITANKLRAATASSNQAVTVGSTPTAFAITKGTYDGQTAYNLVHSTNTALGVCSNSAGTGVLLYAKDDAGSWWAFEEAAIESPRIATLKNVRSGKYMYESGMAVLQAASVSDAAKWIVYPTSGGYMLINNSTHNIVQAPSKNVDVTTAKTLQVLTGVNSGDQWAFGYDDIYLNDRGNAGQKVCGWTGGLTEGGNAWQMAKVADITEEEVLKILRENSPYATSVEDGKYYRLYNETRGNYVYDRYIENAVYGKALDENDYTQVWKAVKTGTGFRLQGAVSEKYIASGTGQSAWATTNAAGTTYNVSVNAAVSSVNKYFNFTFGSYALHMNSTQTLVNWYVGGDEVTASEWLLCEVPSLDADKLAAAKAEYAKVVEKQNEYNQMVSNISKYETVLNGLFTDKSYSELTDAAKAMGDDEFNNAISTLPAMLKDMCLKIRNDSWQLSKGGKNWEKFFRVADYKVYSKSTEMCWVVGMSYVMSRLSNPTGISGDEGDIIALFLAEPCPANATLKVELTEGGERENPRTGEQIALKQGMNLILVKRTQDLFIYYEINSAENNPAYYLDKFKDMKIHIEGGVLNGYYDLTRDMTDSDWADMVASDMLKHGRVFLKGSHVVGNWPSSVILSQNPKAIKNIAEFYNNIPKWEQELMGITNAYLPNIENRYRNVWTALGTDLGSSYMYATSYGTYYNWGTLGDILSTRVLSNGGNQWGPAHEFGHDHQNLFNMVGCTEVSNNVFSNAVIYKMGAAMSRGVALSELIPNYAERKNWMELGIWCKTQMYWKLYQFFHLAGRDTEFFPKVFNIMRSKPLEHKNGQLVPASKDYLHFAEVCCEAANADLSEFFQMYGFFDPVINDTKKGDVECKFIDDYSQYYLYSTSTMIKSSLEYCQSFEKKYLNIGFIDDRIRQTPATYPGAPAGTMRSALNGGGDNSVGTEGTLGMYLDYMEKNYTPAAGYTLKNCYGTTTLKPNIVDGEGAMGFKVYNYDGELVYFANTPTFTIPANVVSKYGLNKTNIRIMAADAFGNDTEVYNKDYVPSAIESVKSDRTARNGVVYDLQGRHARYSDHGLFIVNGKKVVK